MSDSLTAFAVLNDDLSLIFYKNADYETINNGIIANGSYTYNGKTATAIYTGFETTAYNEDNYDTIPWYRQEITSVSFVDKISPISTSHWFNSMRGSPTSYDLTNLDTSKTTDMSWMFGYCDYLTNLDVSGFDTSNVTNMSWMFGECAELTNLDVSGFDTSKVTDMTCMFTYCWNLTNLDVSGFDTSNVTKMGSMFSDCRNLTNLDVSGFDTSKVTDIGFMFAGYNGTTLDLSGWDTSNVTYANCAFYNCENLTTIYVSDLWNMNSVTSSDEMFSGSLLLIGGAGTTYNSNCIDVTYARIDNPNAGEPGYFTYKKYYPYVDESSGKIKHRLQNNNVDLQQILDTVNALPESGGINSLLAELLETKTFTDNEITEINQDLFRGWQYITKISLPKVTKTVSTGYLCYGCTKLEEVYMPECTNLGAYSFYNNTSLKAIDFPKLTAVPAHGFRQCTVATSVNLPVCTSLGTNAFQKDALIESIDFPMLGSIGATAFDQCSALTAVILRKNAVCTLSNVSAFNSTPIKSGTGYIYVPDNLVDSYKAASNWSTYAAQIKPISELEGNV